MLNEVVEMAVQWDNVTVHLPFPMPRTDCQVRSRTALKMFQAFQDVKSKTGRPTRVLPFTLVPTWMAEPRASTALEVCGVPADQGIIGERIETRMNQKWKMYWKDLDQCRQTKLWFPEPNTRLSKSILRLNRAMLGPVLHFITGHGWLNRHKAIVEKSGTPRCRLCQTGSSEEPGHLWRSCPGTAELRSKLRIVDPLRAGSVESHSTQTGIVLRDHAQRRRMVAGGADHGGAKVHLPRARVVSHDQQQYSLMVHGRTAHDN
ncbi:Hypothetical predicted protein, partial [Paramuricea clavata]